MEDGVRRGRPRGFDADDVLDRALDVFWRQGFSGTSYADLTQATGLNKPSLYAAFGDKEALFASVIDRYRDGRQAQLVAAFARCGDVHAGAAALLTGYADLYTGGETPSGCLISSGLAEAQSPHFSACLRDQLVAVSEHTGQSITDRIARAVAEGELPADTDAKALAGFLVAYSLGLAAAARAGATRDCLRATVDVALQAMPRGAANVEKS